MKWCLASLCTPQGAKPRAQQVLVDRVHSPSHHFLRDSELLALWVTLLLFMVTLFGVAVKVLLPLSIWPPVTSFPTSATLRLSMVFSEPFACSGIMTYLVVQARILGMS